LGKRSTATSGRGIKDFPQAEGDQKSLRGGETSSNLKGSTKVRRKGKKKGQKIEGKSGEGYLMRGETLESHLHRRDHQRRGGTRDRPVRKPGGNRQINKKR